MNATVFRSVPALVGSYLLVPTFEGELGAIDVETGELVWRLPADGVADPRRWRRPARSLVAVRGGADAGFEAYEHDPDAALVREASPTTLALGTMLGAMALVARVALAGRCSCSVACSARAWARRSPAIRRRGGRRRPGSSSTRGKTRTRRRDEQEQAEGRGPTTAPCRAAGLASGAAPNPAGEGCSTRSSRPRGRARRSMPRDPHVARPRSRRPSRGTPVLAIAAVALVASNGSARWPSATRDRSRCS